MPVKNGGLYLIYIVTAEMGFCLKPEAAASVN